MSEAAARTGVLEGKIEEKVRKWEVIWGIDKHKTSKVRRKTE